MDIREYIIQDIVHSGRKNLRGLKVDDSKYNGLVGCQIKTLNVSKIKQFEPLKMLVFGHYAYNTWTTSEVVGLNYNHKDNLFCLETVNTLYYLKPLYKVDDD